MINNTSHSFTPTSCIADFKEHLKTFWLITRTSILPIICFLLFIILFFIVLFTNIIQDSDDISVIDTKIRRRSILWSIENIIITILIVFYAIRYNTRNALISSVSSPMVNSDGQPNEKYIIESNAYNNEGEEEGIIHMPGDSE